MILKRVLISVGMLVGVLVLSAIIVPAVLVGAFPPHKAAPFKVDGPAMLPTLRSGDHIMVNRSSGPPKRGDIIAFQLPNPRRDFVKRVIGVPGDVVEVREGIVRVNGGALEEPYLTVRDTASRAEVKLGEREYFVLGDNRRGSYDSRDFGPVPEANLLGKVRLVYWPLSRWSRLR